MHVDVSQHHPTLKKPKKAMVVPVVVYFVL
jgi:hypothetical protein